ncbi:vacuolar protein sorting-associated protein 35 [Ceratobasidium sp. AG-Ba]|nr:vacuolar protein sorting-associated protein 35 [Ceratobasidium sp. AG-Ba]
MDDGKLLAEALSVVKIQMVQMKRCLENDQLMDALKSASTMLAELRTSSLTPKMYYELYMAVFDALRHVSNYLLDAHTSGKHHLADLYELVQYAGNIVPRLYLMITVGSVYMSIPDAPVKEIMKDMMEMSRGVQHPTRGLFLRHYLSGQTRDNLPIGDSQTQSGNLHDSIAFLDGVDLNMYRTLILPILEQVVSCKDVIAQEYLMEVVIQVFTDDFHLHTLTEFLSHSQTPSQSQHQTDRQRADRPARLVRRSRSRKRGPRRSAQAGRGGCQTARRKSPSRTRGKWVGYQSYQPNDGRVGSGECDGSVDEDKGKGRRRRSAQKVQRYSRGVKLFEVFGSRSLNLSRLDRILWDQVLAFAQTKVGEFQDSPDLHTTHTTSNLLSLLLAPITSYTSVLTLLAPTALALPPQPFATRRAVAHAVASVLKNNRSSTERCWRRARNVSRTRPDQRDAGAAMGGVGGAGRGASGVGAEDLAEEQGWVARMVHLFRAEALDVQFELLQTARRFFAEGGPRMRFKAREHVEIDWHNRVTTLFKFIHQLTSVLFSTVESPDTALRLFLLALKLYEDSISESRAQLQAIGLIIGTLQGARVFGEDNYDTLITKAAVHGAKLLKKPHQATAVMLASHMWQTDVPEGEVAGGSCVSFGQGQALMELIQPRRDGKRVLECLQKSLRIASSCFEEVVSVQLYVDALDKYLYYFERGVAEVTPKYINSLIELITSNAMSSPHQISIRPHVPHQA